MQSKYGGSEHLTDDEVEEFSRNSDDSNGEQVDSSDGSDPGYPGLGSNKVENRVE